MQKDMHESTSEPALSTSSTRYDQGAMEEPKRTFGEKFMAALKEPGSALQIVIAAVIAISIGMAVTSTVEEVPEAASVILEVPGTLWLRALRATVLPLIATAIILAVQNLKQMASEGKKLAQWTLGYYFLTTVLAVVHSMILVDLVWRKLMVEATGDALLVDEEDQATINERSETQPHDILVQVFESFVPSNVVGALANDELLAVLVSALVVGCLIKGPDSSILRAVAEVEKMVTRIIVFLIKLAPIGVFFLILANLMTLNIAEVGLNLGVLIGSAIASMALHLFIILPLIFFAFTRMNPYTHWLKCSPAWITGWGTASSAATLPVTIKVCLARGVPNTIVNFAAPLGCLINMDGTAIYFPLVVVFLAATQGIELTAGDYVIIVLLATMSSIASSPIPSSSLVLTVMIAGSVNIPITGMYGVVVAIDWFLDRFRTATNVSGDIFAAKILEKMTGIVDPDHDGVATEVGRDTMGKLSSEPLTPVDRV